MNQIKNINLKFGRTETILKVKKEFGLEMKPARDFVDSVLSYGFINLDTSMKSPESILEIFDGKYVPEETPFDYSPKPDEKTVEALVWMDKLSTEDKDRIELIINWEGRRFVAVG